VLSRGSPEFLLAARGFLRLREAVLTNAPNNQGYLKIQGAIRNLRLALGFTLKLVLPALMAGLVTGCSDPEQPAGAVVDTALPEARDWDEPHMRYRIRLTSLNELIITRTLRTEKVPMVFIFHHLEGERKAPPPRGYEDLENALLARGISTARIYFNTDTEEYFKIRYNDLRDLLFDVRNGMDFLREKNIVDPNRVGALGYDLGGSLALTAAATELPEVNFRTIVLWSPQADYQKGIQLLLGRGVGADLEPGEEMEVLFQGRIVTLTDQFFRSLRGYNPLEHIAQYRGPVLGVTGEKAPRQIADLRQLVNAYQGEEFKTLVIKGADGSLGLENTQSVLADEAVDLTVDWFVEHLQPTPAPEIPGQVMGPMPVEG
jgi:dienelactone hydrolase